MATGKETGSSWLVSPGGGQGDGPNEAHGPPWILGHRGAPWAAPENTLAALRAALEHGLDGFEYDLQRTLDGEAVLLHDDTLGRTTDGSGQVSGRSLADLYQLDAGSWHGPKFEGERIPTFEQAWRLVPTGPAASAPFHMIEIKDPTLLPAVARILGPDKFRNAGESTTPYIIASFHRNVCLEARDMGLPSMLLGELATEADRRFVRDERIDAYSVGPGGWDAPEALEVAAGDWPCQRWSWSVDEPEHLLSAFRKPLFAINTNEPRRALAVRALVALAPADRGAYPLQVDELEITGGGLSSAPLSGARSPGQGQHPSGKPVLEPWTSAWCGAWRPGVRVRNPFPFPVEVNFDLELAGGAFEVGQLPKDVSLAVGELFEFDFNLTGGSRSPGADPKLLAWFRWRDGEGEPWGLQLDTTLRRRRVLELGEETRRLSMLREEPGAAFASVVVRRKGRELLIRIEDSGGLVDPHLVVRLGSEVAFGGESLRVRIPGEIGADHQVFFSVGFEGRKWLGLDAPVVFRRWAGGVPGSHVASIFAGQPGSLRLE
jgi:glycerophosphoryl diester phosphodiesterase